MAHQNGSLVECLEDAIGCLQGDRSYARASGGYVREDISFKTDRIADELCEVHQLILELWEAVQRKNFQLASEIFYRQIEFGFDPEEP